MQLPTCSSALLYILSPLLANALLLDVSSSGNYHQADEGIKYFTDTAAVSIKNASSIVAHDMLSYYHDTEPGMFGHPYRWWEAGAVWGSLIDYWNYTGDAQYLGLVQHALLRQAGPTYDYMRNETKREVHPPPTTTSKTSGREKADRNRKYRETMIK